MPKVSPICCSADAFDLLARQLPAINSPDALLTGAVAIASHQIQGIDVAEVDQTLQDHANKVRARVRSPQRQALLAHLHEYLFEELELAGNQDDYYNPVNSYLPAVLETKRGLPISLSLVYKLVAERVGLRVQGIGLPGHFVVSVQAEGEPILIDPFNGGRELSVDEAHEKVKEIHGPDAEWSGRVASAGEQSPLAHADAPEPVERLRCPQPVRRRGGRPGDGNVALA